MPGRGLYPTSGSQAVITTTITTLATTTTITPTIPTTTLQTGVIGATGMKGPGGRVGAGPGPGLEHPRPLRDTP